MSMYSILSDTIESHYWRRIRFSWWQSYTIICKKANYYAIILLVQLNLVVMRNCHSRFTAQKKRWMISHSAFLLGYPDSNQERQDQNLQCYHYTISQSCFAMSETVVSCLRVQRYKLFLYPARKSRKIFKKSCILTVLCEKRIIFCNFWDF